MEITNLARRVIACKGWRWIPGMLTMPPFARRILEMDLANGLHNEMALPDLTDPATLGCLLSLVRKAREEQTYLPTCIDHLDEAWVIEPPSKVRQTSYESYAEALVAALEAAPLDAEEREVNND